MSNSTLQMRLEAHSENLIVTGEEPEFFSPAVRLVILRVIFIVSFAIRIYAITEPPLEFHPIRQYRYFLVARAYYFESRPFLNGSGKSQVSISKT